jgi:YbbR domain-containing protein
MQEQLSLRNNLIWFAVSILFAFLIWVIATTQANPIGERGFSRIPVQIEVPDGFILTNDPTSSVRVDVRAQQSVLNRLTNDDIIVRADLSNLESGQHVVPLQVNIARTASADTQPTQINVTLEQSVTQQKPVQLEITQAPAADLDYDPPLPDVLQVQVSGASNQVAEIVAVRGELDLSQQRTSFEIDVPLVPIDIEGNVVSGVTVTPRNTRVSVALAQRDDVQQVSVRPNILVTSLPEGYLLESISYEPQTVFLSGSPSALQGVGTSVNTNPITLLGRTDDFTLEVPLSLPSSDLIVLNDASTITVTVGISAQSSAVQLDNIPITVIGAGDGDQIAVSPPNISVVLNGAIDTLEDLTSDDLEAIVDVSGLVSGTYELEPNIVVQQGQIVVDSRTPLPSLVSVTIDEFNESSSPEATADAPTENTPTTNSVTPTVTPRDTNSD